MNDPEVLPVRPSGWLAGLPVLQLAAALLPESGVTHGFPNGRKPERARQERGILPRCDR